jgi:proton-dependent oligopeptide transporter, POT family
MKSLVMALYLFAVFIGNLFTAEISRFIQIPSSAEQQWKSLVKSQPSEWIVAARNVILPGFDQVTGTDDDFVARVSAGSMKSIDFADGMKKIFDQAAQKIESISKKNGDRFPKKVDQLGNDIWGRPIIYSLLSQNQCRIISSGADGKLNTKWDIGLTIQINQPARSESTSWLDKIKPSETWILSREKYFGITKKNTTQLANYERSNFSGGQTKLTGSSYFRFYTILVLVAAVAFIPFALFYKPKNYFSDFAR